MKTANRIRNVRPCGRYRLSLLALACCASFQALANPLGAQVVSGSATLNQSGSTLTVTNSPNAIINWQGFSIGQGETTHFIQQNASSAVLNRVIGTDPSQLLGTLSSNGRVFLVNPSGILVGQGARIDVAGMVASTLNLSNEDFLAGRLNFGPTPNAGGIQNAGSITTPDGGTVYLIAPQVENQGLITTPKGGTILAAGNAVQLIDTATPGVSVQITGSDNNAVNVGRILADSGRIGMVGALVRNSGELNASSLVSQGGRVFLKASQDAYVDKDATIIATGSTGGSIEVLGNRVAVMDNARLDASGQSGGGTVLVGGDYQGKNPDVQNAQNTFVGSNATISADATDTGNGGKVIVWADDTTRVYGSISARGGVNGGDGGFVETSGHYLEARGRVDLSAPQGRIGTWLLDPASIEIAGGSGDGDLDANVTSFGGTGGTTQAAGQITFAYGNTGPSIVYQSEIEGQSSGAFITLEATDSIFTSGTFVGGAVTLAAGSHLTLRTRNQATPDLATGIDLTGSVDGVNLEFITQGAGTITIETGTGGTGPYHAAPITTGKLTSAAGITLNASGNVNINGLVKATAGSLAVTSQTGNIATGASGSLAASTVTLNAAGNIGSAGSRLLFNTIAPNSVVVGDAIVPTALYTDMSGSIIFGAVATNGIADFLTSGGTLTFSGDVTTNGANVVIKSASDLTQNVGTTINAGAGTISILGSGFGAALNGTLATTNTGANAVSIEDIGGNLTLGNINSSGGVVIGNGFDIRGNVTQNAGTTIAGSSVGIQAQGGVSVQTINAGAGNVGIKVIGDVVDGNGITNNVTAGQLDVLAGGGYSLNANLSGNLNIGKLYSADGVTPTTFTAIAAGDLTINGTAIGAIGAGINGFTQARNIAMAINAAVPAGVTAYLTSAGTVGFATTGATPVAVAFAGSANTANTGLTSPSMTTATTAAAFNLGAGTIGGSVSASNAAGNINLAGSIASGSSISLVASGAITQSAGALLGGAALYAGGSAVTLNEANPVGVISGATTAGDFVYNSASLLTVSNVGGVNGISVPTAFNIRLSSDVGINQNAGSVIKANGANGGGLALITAGPVFLDQANDVRTIAANLTGAGSGFLFANSENNVDTYGDLVVGSVTAGGLPTVTGITTNGGDISLDTPGLLTVLNPIAAGAGRIGLFADDLILSNTVTSTSEVGIAPYSANVTITVGAACATPPCLSVTNLWQVDAPTIGIGEDGSLGGGGANNPLAGAISVAGITTGGATLSDRHANTTRIGLFSGAGITQTGIINVQDLGVSAGTGVTLTGANMVSNLAGKSATGPFQFTNAQTFNIAALSGGSGFSAYSMPGIQALSGDVVLTANGATSDIVANSPQNYAAIIATNGNVTLNAGRDVLIGNSGGTFADVYAYGAAKNVSVTAARNILVDNFSFILSEAGNVSLTATGGNVSIRSSVNGSGSWIGAGTAGTGGIVTISAPAGFVLAPAPGYGGDVGGGHISTGTGGELVVTAYSGITLNGFNTVAGFSASNGIVGDVVLSNSSSPLNILNILNPSGAVSVTNLGAIAVGVNGISAGGAVALTSGSAGSPTTSDIISINGPVTGSSVTLAANSVTGTIPAGATVLTYTAPPPPPPTVDQCVVDPTLAGCTAVLPPLADCTLNPALAGCIAVLPSLADCTLNPTLAGCTAVLPAVASPPVQTLLDQQANAIVSTITSATDTAANTTTNTATGNTAPSAAPTPVVYAPLGGMPGAETPVLLGPADGTIGGTPGTFGGGAAAGGAQAESTGTTSSGEPTAAAGGTDGAQADGNGGDAEKKDDSTGQANGETKDEQPKEQANAKPAKC